VETTPAPERPVSGIPPVPPAVPPVDTTPALLALLGIVLAAAPGVLKALRRRR